MWVGSRGNWERRLWWRLFVGEHVCCAIPSLAAVVYAVRCTGEGAPGFPPPPP